MLRNKIILANVCLQENMNQTFFNKIVVRYIVSLVLIKNVQLTNNITIATNG